MRLFLSIFVLFSLQFNAWNQCNLMTTASSQPTTCAGNCDGQIFFVYQNTAAPGAPYMINLLDSVGNVINTQTFLSEIGTIPYSGLCAGNYTINIQGSSCFAQQAAIVSSPAAIAADLITADPTPGNSDGSVTINATGGTGGYTYSIDGITFQGGNMFSGLPAGNYTAYVLDANGCLGTFDFILSDPSTCNIVVTATAQPVLCYGTCTGTLTYIYYDPQNNGPYTVELIQSGSTIQSATNASPNGSGTFTNVCAGIYTVEVTDINGCSGSYIGSLTEPTQLTVTNVNTVDATPGNNDGSATFSVTGGSPSYGYSLDGITYQSSATFNNLAPGVYVGYVQDANGCIVIYTFSIQQDPGCFFNLSAMATSQASCYGSCDGEITYTFAGMPSDPTFSILLQNNGTTVQSLTSTNQTNSGVFSGLCAGDYSIIVNNSSGCSEAINVAITQPAYMNANYNSTNPTSGNSDGQIEVLVNGGTPAYQFSIDNGATWQASNIFTNLAAGFYIINFQDANGCTTIVCVILSDSGNCDFFLTTSVTPITCYGACDGMIQYSYNDMGNNPPYTIEVIQGGTTLFSTISSSNGGSGQFVGFCDGNYLLQITDADGCSDSEINYIINPDQLIVNSANITNATLGNSDGTAEIFASGGTAPYQYSIDNGVTYQPGNLFTNLAPGIYVCYVQDANGCIAIFTFVVNEDPGCFINATIYPTNQISCSGACDGELSFTYVESVNNGPYTIELFSGLTNVGTLINASNNFSGSFTGLCADNYYLTVTNADGCTSYIVNYTLTEPAPLNVSVNVTDASVGTSNGSVIMSGIGGTGQYMYSLDGITYQSSNTFNGLSSGIYVAYIIDENLCSDIYSFIVSENTNCNIFLTVSPGYIACPGSCNGEINFGFNDANNNPPYTVTLTNQNGGTQIQTFSGTNGGTGDFFNLCAGVYTLTVQDADGCETIQTIQLAEPTYMIVSAVTIDATTGNSDGSATINVTGGTAPYQFSLDNGVTWQTSNTLTGLGAGYYIVNIEDANGCSTIFCFIMGDSNVASLIEFDREFLVYPNPTSGILYVVSSTQKSINLYDLTGKTINVNQTKTEQLITIDLNGIAKGMYILEAIDANGNVERLSVIKN